MHRYNSKLLSSISCRFLQCPLTCRRFTKLRIFNTFDYKYRQNLVSKITNSDKSQAPQFRETAVSGCRSYFARFSVFIRFFFHVLLFTFLFFTFLNYAQNLLRFNFQRKTFTLLNSSQYFQKRFGIRLSKFCCFFAFAFQKLLNFLSALQFPFLIKTEP